MCRREGKEKIKDCRKWGTLQPPRQFLQTEDLRSEGLIQISQLKDGKAVSSFAERFAHSTRSLKLL